MNEHVAVGTIGAALVNEGRGYQFPEKVSVRVRGDGTRSIELGDGAGSRQTRRTAALAVGCPLPPCCACHAVVRYVSPTIVCRWSNFQAERVLPDDAHLERRRGGR